MPTTRRSGSALPANSPSIAPTVIRLSRTSSATKASPTIVQGGDEEDGRSARSHSTARSTRFTEDASESIPAPVFENLAGEEEAYTEGRNRSAVNYAELEADGDAEDAEGEVDNHDVEDVDGNYGENDAEMGYEYPAAEDLSRSNGRSTRKKAPKVVDSEEDEDDTPKALMTTSSSGRTLRRPSNYAEPADSDESVDFKPKKSNLRRGGSQRQDFVVPDEEYDQSDEDFGARKSSRRVRARQEDQHRQQKAAQSARRARERGGTVSRRSEPKPRNTRNSQKDVEIDQSFSQGETSDSSTDDENDDGKSVGDNPLTVTRLRNKKPVDYYAPLALEAEKKRGRPKNGGSGGNPFSGMPVNMTGAQYAALYPDKNGEMDSDDSDNAPGFSTPRKAALFQSGAAAAAAGFGGMFAGAPGLDMGGGAGVPSNLGKVTATLADTDPLGVDSGVSFDSVGGLGSHIQQLKEMVSLPLLYPEVFERFNITPPRGVLFHGPPGTGKTLLARALAASCSTEGRKISFFMRKGADCLSKWVGEAERQLRLLFDEAKACQPSIIFFDEIDGLAPVRSSKQDQVHASIVSTLLALMDGMDGRGQVIVIGATNRPDAIDPALRRPGRFDREFYFPLPNLEGRRKILDIHTSGWTPPIEESFKDELAALTKGYGGADLRALCTEAALNAVQRTYPQIYKTNDRLVINPQTIDVTARDFIVSQKNLIPSTARATSSSAAPIPPQLVPLLSEAFESAKVALSKVLPEVKKAKVLEEAEWEDDGGGFEKEKMMQAFETLRVFRPRMLICGEEGMGQGYIGAAVLHHLEGFHVQTLDLATLVADSGRTMEAACVQLFVEAKRHKPSILFIPSLATWCLTVTDTVKSTVKGLLDGLDSSDPVLLLAVVDGPISDLPPDVRGWFGFVKGNRVVMQQPGADQRKSFFDDVLKGIARPPNEFPDAMPRRKRILEKLAIAPPPPPRVPTAAEILQIEQADLRQLEYLKWKLGPVLNELKKRYKRFTRSFYADWKKDDFNRRVEEQKDNEPIIGFGTQPYHNVDLDTMHLDLYKGHYHTPDDFLADILRIQNNADINAITERDVENPIKAGQMVNHVNVMLDQTFEAPFRADCAKMAERYAERDQKLPPGQKGKGKGKGKPVVVGHAAVAALAAAGGGVITTRSKPDAAIEEGLGVIDIENGERSLKRARIEGEESQGEGEEEGASEHGQGPAKRIRTLDEEQVTLGESEAIVEPIASTSQLEGAHVNTNGTSAFSDLLNPGSYLPYPSNPSSDYNPYEAMSTSVHEAPAGLFISAPESYPGVNAMESSGLLDDSIPATLPLLPEVVSSQYQSPRPSRITLMTSIISPPSFAPASFTAVVDGEVAPTVPNSREVTPTPTEIPAVLVTPARSPIVIDPPTPEPLPDFVLSEFALGRLSTFLTEETGNLNVDQLEQLRAACYDVIWRARKGWERDEMVEELDALAREFVEEVNSLVE